MPKIFLCSLVVTVSCLLAAGGASAFTPNPDAPDAVPVPPFNQAPHVPSSVDPTHIINPPFSTSTSSTTPAPSTVSILPLPPSFPPFQLISVNVTGTIDAVSSTFMAASSSGPIGTSEQASLLKIRPPCFPPRLYSDVSTTPGVMTLSFPDTTATLKVVIFDTAQITDPAGCQIDTTNLQPGDKVSVGGVRFRGTDAFMFATTIKRLNFIPPVIYY